MGSLGNCFAEFGWMSSIELRRAFILNIEREIAAESTKIILSIWQLPSNSS